MTIRKALKLVIDSYPDYAEFDGIGLLRQVRNLIDKKNCFDGSIFRVMRYCRDRWKEINYEVISQPDSIYRKLPLCEPAYRVEGTQLCLMRRGMMNSAKTLEDWIMKEWEHYF